MSSYDFKGTIIYELFISSPLCDTFDNVVSYTGKFAAGNWMIIIPR